jgi:hypothetical protein
MRRNHNDKTGVSSVIGCAFHAIFDSGRSETYQALKVHLVGRSRDPLPVHVAVWRGRLGSI